MAWLFWLFVLVGGWTMGILAIRTGLTSGFGVAVALNAVVWIGCGLYAVPPVLRLLRR